MGQKVADLPHHRMKVRRGCENDCGGIFLDRAPVHLNAIMKSNMIGARQLVGKQTCGGKSSQEAEH